METRNWARIGLAVVGTALLSGDAFADQWLGSTTSTGSIGRAGYVGIGTTAPAAGLHIIGTDFPGSFIFLQADANRDAGLRFMEGAAVKYHLYNDSSENALRLDGGVVSIGSFLGVGTTSPGARIHIRETAAGVNPNLEIEDSVGDGIHIGVNAANNYGALSSHAGGVPSWDTLTWKEGRVGIGGTPWVMSYTNGEVVKPTLTVHGDIRVENVPVWNGPDEYDLTWGNGADNGISYGTPKLLISREGSSLRYKRNLQVLDEPFMKMLSVTPKRYQAQPGYGPSDAWTFGYVAEELHAAGLHNLVIYDAKGRPDGVKYKKVAIYVNEVVKSQQRTIEELRAEVDELKRVVNELRR